LSKNQHINCFHMPALVLVMWPERADSCRCMQCGDKLVHAQAQEWLQDMRSPLGEQGRMALLDLICSEAVIAIACAAGSALAVLGIASQASTSMETIAHSQSAPDGACKHSRITCTHSYGLPLKCIQSCSSTMEFLGVPAAYN